MTQIERRTRQIQNIRKSLKEFKGLEDDITSDPQARYNIGQTQNNPVHMPTWTQKYSSDPALDVYVCNSRGYEVSDRSFSQGFVAKLRALMLPRIRLLHESEPRSKHPKRNTYPAHTADEAGDPKHVIFKDDRIYVHKLMSVNYTTYDVRRTHDIIWPATSRNNILLTSLSCSPTGEPAHGVSTETSTGYMYARVLRIFHCNVIYTGPGSVDFRPRRMDFLFVRYYSTLPGQGDLWARGELERIAFLPATDPSAFGFVDPEHILRSVHIIPKYSSGRKYSIDERGVSATELANDSMDWKEYYVSR